MLDIAHRIGLVNRVSFDLILPLIVLFIPDWICLYYPTVILDCLRGFVVLDVTD